MDNNTGCYVFIVVLAALLIVLLAISVNYSRTGGTARYTNSIY